MMHSAAAAMRRRGAAAGLEAGQGRLLQGQWAAESGWGAAASCRRGALLVRPFASTSSSSDASSSPPDRPPPPASSLKEPSSASHSDQHALAKPEPHPLVKSEPHPLVTAASPYPAYLSSLSRSIRRAAASLPSAAGRPPPKDQLLSLTNSFFERLKIRFKWATIRSYRRFRADDYSAFFSFGILGTLGWFLLKTTSAFAVLFFVVNSLSLQEWLAGKLGAYLTDSTGVKVVFESAIVPKWGIFGQGGSRIVFKNVYISRGPVKGELGVLPVPEHERTDESEDEARLREMVAQWTHFHLSIDTVEVSLSLGRWLDGKGLIKDAAVRGVRGVIGASLSSSPCSVQSVRVADVVALARRALAHHVRPERAQGPVRLPQQAQAGRLLPRGPPDRGLPRHDLPARELPPCASRPLARPRLVVLARLTSFRLLLAVHLLDFPRRHPSVPQAVVVLRPHVGRLDDGPVRQLPVQPAPPAVDRPHERGGDEGREVGPHGAFPLSLSLSSFPSSRTR